MSLDPAVAAVRRAVRAVLDDANGQKVLVACSGGADSMALLAATVFEGHKAGLEVYGVTVDHGLQEGSAEHAADVVRQMAGLGADETVSARIEVTGDGSGPEAAARQARYAVLGDLAQRFEAGLVLLGHTRDDQAETVLLGLTRGSGGRSIAGMRRSFDKFRRPLLEVSSADTAAACDAEGIAVWHDPHNDDPRFTRVRVRHQVLPMLESELGPGVAVALARTADVLRPDMEYLDQLADAALREVAVADGLNVAGVAALPPPLRSRVLRLAALAAGSPSAELFLVHVQALVALVVGEVGGKQVQLPGHVTAVRTQGVLAFRRTA